MKRNVRGNDRFYVRQGHEGYDFFVSLYEKGANWKMVIFLNLLFLSLHFKNFILYLLLFSVISELSSVVIFYNHLYLKK